MRRNLLPFCKYSEKHGLNKAKLSVVQTLDTIACCIWAFHIIVHCMPSYTYVCIYRQRVLCGTICIGELNMPQATKLSWNIASPSSMYLAYCKLVKIVKELSAIKDNSCFYSCNKLKFILFFSYAKWYIWTIIYKFSLLRNFSCDITKYLEWWK